MLKLLTAITFSYAAILPVLNPLGSAVIFLSLTMGAADKSLSKLSRQIGLNTFVLLVAVLLTGSWVLRFFGITIPVVQVGGGFVVAYIGWTLLNQSDHHQPDPGTTSEKDISELAFYPLTMPVTAGPGSIATTLTVGAHQISTNMQDTMLAELGAVIGIFLAALTVYFCYRYARTITKSLGGTGTQVITRLFAFINVCIGIQIMWHGIAALITSVTL